MFNLVLDYPGQQSIILQGMDFSSCVLILKNDSLGPINCFVNTWKRKATLLKANFRAKR